MLVNSLRIYSVLCPYVHGLPGLKKIHRLKMVVTLYSGITEKCITQKPSGKSRKTNKKQDKIEEFNNFEGRFTYTIEWVNC